VIIVVYQAVINLPRIPLWVGLSVAQLAGMIADGLVFDGFYGSFDPAKLSAGITVKAIAGLAASIPTATYITFVLRDAHDDVVDGVLHRGVLEIVTLKRELESANAALEKSNGQRRPRRRPLRFWYKLYTRRGTGVMTSRTSSGDNRTVQHT
jgi:hypothetical protein